MEMISRHIMRHAIVAAIVSVLFVAPVTFMLIDRTPPYVRVSGKILPEHPVPGDFLTVEWTVSVNRSCPPNTPRNVTRRVIDSIGKYHDYEPVPGLYGNANMLSDTIVRKFQLSDGVSIGPAVYQSKACYACNPLQIIWPICIDKPDLKFEIGEKLR